eukprot:CAMPEP_0172405762 /NCGR_PEP_ID=MMETSP1061-20121228/68130_1 /TAXON_ID=37318 /ORGANISM="Pseudo-nitzschia pungens, Strain cf. pungens" /LENGTH=48 /DNA_ID= /DNA_START= /DNA_END= /DNA_ORIENTATION=
MTPGSSSGTPHRKSFETNRGELLGPSDCRDRPEKQQPQPQLQLQHHRG